MDKNENKIIYFASDLHLGVPNRELSLARERKFIAWLDKIKLDANELYLLGDVFDMWFEYKTVVPKGFTRLFGKLAELSDSGIKIHYFTGNHDMWTTTYFTQELGIEMHREPEVKVINGLRFYIAHGDGLGRGDFGYKLLKIVFESSVCRWLFERIHPNTGLGIAHYFSRKSRIANGEYDEVFYGNEKEVLVQHCVEISKQQEINCFVFGHRHLSLQISISSNAVYYNIGEWIKKYSYLRVENQSVELLSFNS